VRLLLIRHGQSEGNASGVVQGRLDFGLSTLGREQAEVTAARLAAERVERVIASPLRRAMETADPIARALGLDVEPVDGLLEYDIGAISGLTGPQIRERYPDVVAAYARGERPGFPGEEGRDIFFARVREVLESRNASGQAIAAIAHGGVIGGLCYAAVGLDYSRSGVFQAANCSITEIRRDFAGRLVLHRHNDTCHLGPLVTTVDRG